MMVEKPYQEESETVAAFDKRKVEHEGNMTGVKRIIQEAIAVEHERILSDEAVGLSWQEYLDSGSIICNPGEMRCIIAKAIGESES